MINLSPYILFNGDCAEAMKFYQTCLGGELSITTVGESPVKNQMPTNSHGKVVNARLHNAYFGLSASDWLHPTRSPVKGNTVCVYVNGGTYEELREIFTKLSQGADQSLLDPLQSLFFGTYGALTDKYGVRWMFQGESSTANVK